MENHVIAEYRATGIPAYDNNPLIEAFPPILEDNELVPLLGRKIPYDNAQRKLPAAIRRHSLEAIQTCFIPLPDHLALANTFSRMVRTGYEHRNPMNPKQFAMIVQQRVRMTSQMRGWDTAPEQIPGMSLIGASGIGKSSAWKRTLGLYPQTIEHESYKGSPLPLTQIVWLKLDLPFDASVKGLVTKFFAEVDRLLGSNYRKTYMNSRRTTDDMMPDMAVVGALHSLGCLVIDEIQHISAAKSGGAEKILNFFVELSNTMKIPLVLIGTQKATRVLGAEFQSARRATGQGSFFWNRMKNDDFWEHFLSELWTYQYTATETKLEKSLIDVFHTESQGITHLAVALYVLTQEMVIGGSREERITPELVSKAAKTYFKPVADFLDCLKKGSNESDTGDLGRFDALAAREERNKTIQLEALKTQSLHSPQPEEPIKKNVTPPAGGLLEALRRAEKEKRSVADILAEKGDMADITALNGNR